MNTTTLSSQSTDAPRRGSAEWIQRKGLEVMRREAEAIRSAAERQADPFADAVLAVFNCPGRIAVTGVGKAGDIGKKIQGTLSSTGTPAYVLHPVEAAHGDLGMMRSEDVVVALSKSGETQELSCVLAAARKIGCKTILLTSNLASRCAKQADIVLDIGDTPEACPLGMAPSASTAAMLALGDAVALTVMELKDIKAEEYATFHPGGALGRSLMRVHEIMRTDNDCPRVHVDGTLQDYDRAVREAPRRAGAAAVVDDDGRLVGFFTHGDLSRLLSEPEHPARRRLRDVMTTSPKVIHADDRVAAAISIMQPHRIDELPVVDNDHRVVGMIDIQDLLAEGFSCFDDD